MLGKRLGLMVLLSGLASPVLAAPRSPFPGGGPPHAVSVPEIDASAGLLAVAAVATALLFAWERRRRARA